MTTDFKSLTCADMLRRMGDALGKTNGAGRYPDLEQDAMRYWVTRDLLVNFVQGDYEKLDKLMDDKIHRILNGEPK